MKGMLNIKNRVFRFGFTGTQEGTTELQFITLEKIIKKIAKKNSVEHHNGGCVGSDEECYHLVRRYIPTSHIVMHPPKNRIKTFKWLEQTERKPLDYLKRNMQIVAESDILIATPKTVEEELRSGTWSTIRYARMARILIIIIFPNGSYRYEKPEKIHE